MAPTYEGHLKAGGFRFGIVASRFNQIFTRQLVQGALDCLVRHGASEKDIDIVWVPGTFEIPMTANRLVEKGEYSAVICVGTLIRGETDHYDHLATQVNRGISEISLNSGIPITNGVLTCDSMEQAQARSSAKMGNKGWDAALAAVEMADLVGKLDG